MSEHYVDKPIVMDDTGKRMARGIEAIARVLGGKVGTVYGFHINGGDSNPATCVTYLRDAAGMTPAKMDYANDVFDYGSWRDAFFMPRPCMVKYNGEVDYYLDLDDYSKKEDGVTTSDIANTSYAGNAMMEWPLIYIKIVPDADNKSGSVYIADHKADEDFECWSNINSRGEVVDHFFTPIYNGTIISSKLRSISGMAYSDLCQNKTASQEMDLAHANNIGADVIWETEVYSDIMLINALLILMGKSTNTQAVFGNGRYNQSSAASSMLGTGTMNDKGLFWGDDDATHGVKVFGMENWYGNQWRRYAGHIIVDGSQKVKLTRGQQDGSSVDGYNTTGNGYLTIGATPADTNGGYIDKMEFNEKGMIPKNSSGSSSTYYCDGLWFNNSGTRFALRGGACASDLRVGALYCYLDDGPSYANWSIGAAVSCKPLA